MLASDLFAAPLAFDDIVLDAVATVTDVNAVFIFDLDEFPSHVFAFSEWIVVGINKIESSRIVQEKMIQTRDLFLAKKEIEWIKVFKQN